MSIDHLKTLNAERWAKMKVHGDLTSTFDRVAHRLCAQEAKVRYEAVSVSTHVPWWIIAVIHEREASQSWLANLAQGDPWASVSRHVPKGQGPFNSWEAAAQNALSRSPPYASRWTDWGPGGALTLLELYNGTGYYTHGLPSPYVWAGSDQYSHGKFVSDHHFDPNAIDHQLGCAPLISRMQIIDRTIEFEPLAV